LPNITTWRAVSLTALSIAAYSAWAPRYTWQVVVSQISPPAAMARMA
jgi:hypothetical protein